MTDQKRIMLVCGGGASSGFLAQSMRKAAKKEGLSYEIFAKSETDIDNFKTDIDILLIGPHLRFLENEIQEKLTGLTVKMAVIDNAIYGTLDGKKAIEKVQEMLSQD